MITGLRVGFTGEEICAALNGRIERLRLRAEWWKHQAGRPLENQTIGDPILPTHICMNEERLMTWKADVLTVIRDRIQRSEVYLLDKQEQSLAGVIPSKPALVDPYGPDNEMMDGFSVERVDTHSEESASLCIRREESAPIRP